MIPSAHQWSAAVFSGFAQPSDWQRWADHQIEREDTPDNWVLLMSLARTKDEFGHAIQDRLCQEDTANGRELYIGNAKLGYLYWMFRQRRLSFIHLLNLAGDEADGGTGSLSCESVYSILNELELRLACGSPFDDLLTRTEHLFADFFAIAKSEWQQLENEYMDETKVHSPGATVE